MLKFIRVGKKLEKNNTPINFEEILKRKLKDVFKFNSFRQNQQTICLSVLEKNDNFGSGKSLLYQLPAICYPVGVTVVISPLISLMKDQVYFLRRRGIEARIWSSSEKKSLHNDLSYRSPKTKIVYTTPESILNKDLESDLIGLCNINKLNLIAIDEAHCISSWGHDFRPKYLKLGKLKRIYRNVPIIALTATATRKVKVDILKNLNLRNPKVFISSFNRPEISYEIRYIDSIKRGLFEDIKRFVMGHKNEFGIIYCRRRKDVDSLTKYLRKFKLNALGYHAGKKKSKRVEIQEKWKSDRVKILCATIAFGMGVDKPNIRYVIHACVPKSIEAFYQESGRAGRDGNPAMSILYYSQIDKGKIEYLIGRGRDEVLVKQQLQLFETIVKMCENSCCRREFILKYFEETQLIDLTSPEKRDICKKTCDYCKNPFAVKELVRKNCHSSSSRRLGTAVPNNQDIFKIFNTSSITYQNKTVEKNESDNDDDEIEEISKERFLNNTVRVTRGEGQPLNSFFDDLIEDEQRQNRTKGGFQSAKSFDSFNMGKKNSSQNGGFKKRKTFKNRNNSRTLFRKKRKVTKGIFNVRKL